MQRSDEHRQQLHQDGARSTQDRRPQERKRPTRSSDQDGADHGTTDGCLTPDAPHDGSADEAHDHQSEGEQARQQGYLSPTDTELALEWRQDRTDAIEQVGADAADPEQDLGQAAARRQQLGLGLHQCMVAHHDGVGRRVIPPASGAQPTTQGAQPT